MVLRGRKKARRRLACHFALFRNRPQEDQLGALGLVVNAIVLWNTLYMAVALKELSRGGFAVYPEDVARLSPLIRRHLNFQGRHAFVLPEAVAQGQLRPLRDPRQEL